MRIYNFDETPDRLGSDCLKWDVYGPTVIPLWVADMDFVSPEPVVRALKEKVEHGVFGYPSGLSGDSGPCRVELGSEAALFHQRRTLCRLLAPGQDDNQRYEPIVSR